MPNPPNSVLEKAIGYQFEDRSFLKQALTHRSAASKNNERLEFIGDAILGQVIGLKLFQIFPKASEGQLSRLRSLLVKGKTLAELAREFDLGQFLILGSGEMKSGGHRRDSILADTVEAIIGSVFLDCKSLAKVEDLILSWYSTRLENLTVDSSDKDPKTQLQEWLQARKIPLPDYDVVKTEGKAHDMTFYIECTIPQCNITVDSVAKSRKKAEQLAAEKALKRIHS
jgi:ribonuclease III